MVHEKLKKALTDAVEYYNDGLSADEAIVKSASEHDLTVDQTDRVVESFNTAKTINYFDKNASDRTGKFDLASKKNVTLAIFGKNPAEKTASVKAQDVSAPIDSFYLSDPDVTGNRKQVFAEKRAAALDFLAKLAEAKWAHGYSDKTLQDMASDTYSVIKSAEADIDSAIGAIDNYLWSATEKIAKELSRGPYDIPEDRANLFKVACPHSLVVREVSKFSALLKEATGGEYVRMNIVDTEPVDDLLKEADSIMEAVALRREYRQKKAEFKKRASTLKSALLRDPSLSGKIASADKPEDLLHRPSCSKTAAPIDPMASLDTLISVQSRKDNNESMRDEARGALLADLLSSDPILQDADPRQVASIYKSIVASSPRVSMNKEIIRSILRGAVNSIALSPNDTKVLTDVDKGINFAYGGKDGKEEEQ